MGYYQAGFADITGVDIQPQPRYPFQFVQADALEYLAEDGHKYDAIHASPPCQGYSIMNNLPWLRHREYPLLILPTLEILNALGKPYVLENVMGARHSARGLKKRGLEAHGLKAGWLCGTMFRRPFYRHRLFATNWLWLMPGHPKHRTRIRADHNQNGTLTRWQSSAAVGIGHAKGWRLAAEAMGVDWMKQEELTQAIPPVYTEWIGKQMLLVITAELAQRLPGL